MARTRRNGNGLILALFAGLGAWLFTRREPPAPGGNRAPVVAFPVSDVAVLQGAPSTTIDLFGTFSDPDGDALTLSVQGNSNPALVSPFFVGVLLILDYAALQSGEATITIRATDAGGLFVQDTFRVTVTPAPISEELALDRALFGIQRDLDAGLMSSPGLINARSVSSEGPARLAAGIPPRWPPPLTAASFPSSYWWVDYLITTDRLYFPFDTYQQTVFAQVEAFTGEYIQFWGGRWEEVF